MDGVLIGHYTYIAPMVHLTISTILRHKGILYLEMTYRENSIMVESNEM